MLDFIAGNSTLIVAVLVFVTVILFLEGVYLAWKSYRGGAAKKVEKRLEAFVAANDHVREMNVQRQRALSEVPLLERLLPRLRGIHRLQHFIYQAGLAWTVSRFLLTSVLLGAAMFLATASIAHQPVLFAALASMPLAALPLLYVSLKRSRRLAAIEKQLPDAIDLLIRALRSGHAFSSGLHMIGEETSEPIANEFRIVHDEVTFGVSLQQALMNLSERIPLTDLRYFVVAVLIQRESGGNLTEILGNLSRLIRERLKLLGKIRVLSSEGRLSAWILGIMPFALAAVMNLVNPEFMSLLWNDPIGVTIIKYMLALMAVGVVILVRIVRIRV